MLTGKLLTLDSIQNSHLKRFNSLSELRNNEMNRFHCENDKHFSYNIVN